MTSNSEKSTQNKSSRTPGNSGLRILKRCAMVLLPFVLVAIIASSFVFVDEAEYVIVERLGGIVAVYDRPEDRGPHVKLPWPIDVVRSFDRRVQLFDPPGREMFTKDKKNITVDAYVCWKIADPAADPDVEASAHPVVRFFSSLGNIGVAEATLDSRLRSILSTRIGQVELSELLHVDSSEQGPDVSSPGRLDEMAQALRQALAHQPGEQFSLEERLGVEIVDVRIRRLNLPSGNQQAVFDRMRSERRKIADRYRSAGMAKKAVIESQADRQHAEILAKAARQAEETRGKAEAEAIGILNHAHAQDPELHRVLQTLDTYRNILNEKTTLVLSASSNLLKLLTDGVPNLQNEKPPVPDAPTEAPKPQNGEPAPKLSDAKQAKTRPTKEAP
jgi:membrane protease subunit HflC